MSHVTATSPRARVTDHAVRRYCERYLGAVLDETVDDQRAMPVLRKAGHDLAQVRARLADVGGVLMAAGHHTGNVVAFPEAMKVRVADGVVVTVLARVSKPPAGPASQVPARPRTVLELGVTP
ncbi:hypothetical protein [Methylobacterium platani]|uniref:Uncharacterized protein n=2 Tax=Methylobacterium platani TaxID=427683 RepID=A0A179SAM8_9HYPH|nr:hypothetical protein [Methylobacterium platani]KMO15990.1 hypothetical protein SQ03_15550 [Methylobacterium platani JCM 14648]OAS24879.1 hypothetical protein A5481_12365 [Methylobacterium platani]